MFHLILFQMEMRTLRILCLMLILLIWPLLRSLLLQICPHSLEYFLLVILIEVRPSSSEGVGSPAQRSGVSQIPFGTKPMSGTNNQPE